MPPSFWYKPPSVPAWLLAPLGWLYDLAGRLLRAGIKSKKAPAPVICVGNVTLGGAGKTPVVAEAARLLREKQVEAHILSRGYGGRAVGPLRVDPTLHAAEDVGDEPLLLCKTAPVWVARRKRDGVRAAFFSGARAIVMDDGLQNLSLHKDLSLLVVDAGFGFGNGLIFPAGPLREKPESALARVDAVILIGAGGVPPGVAASGKPVLRARAETTCAVPLAKRRVLAFCGLGLPEKFFAGLRERGAETVACRPFPDHYAWTEDELDTILKDARELKALPVTTEKDWQRIPSGFRPRVTSCGLRLTFENATALPALLEKVLHAAR